MKKTLALCSVLALVAVVFAPSAGACGKKAVQAASAQKVSEKAASCPLAAKEARKKGCCVAKTAKYIKKCFDQADDGSLTCTETGATYARTVKDGDEVVYAAGDSEKTYSCKYDAASATWDKTYPDEANPFHKICFDDDGNIVCGPSCETAIVKAKRNETETIYVADGKDYDCAYEALFAIAPKCKKLYHKKETASDEGASL
jgi:hypothetical protein